MEESERDSPTTGIQHVPEEILEYILCQLSPYRDYKSAMMVCKLWYKVMQGVIQQEFCNFHRAVNERCIEWTCQLPEYGSTITERYSHSACYHNKSMYIFGGCTSSSTTFNDLWRFDLCLQQWIRPLALGTYPSPKACASLVAYNDALVLFGGWSHPTPYPLHQAARFFNQLHVYTPSSNRWSHVLPRAMPGTPAAPPGTAGHSATVVGNKMVVFGGSHGHGVSCNDVWVLDLDEMMWQKMEISGAKPTTRYGHSQVTVDNQHILIIGGCGGPNNQFTDVWLLRMGEDEWRWTEMKIQNAEFCPHQLWCHPACKVGDKVAFLSKTNKLPLKSTTAETQQPNPVRCKVWVPPKENPGRSTGQGSAESQERSRRAQFKRRLPDTSESSSQESLSDSEDSAVASSALLRFTGASGRTDKIVAIPSGSKSGAENAAAPVRPGMPCVRPNAMKNRQKQLEMLKRYEDRFKSHNARAPAGGASSDASQSGESEPPSGQPRKVINPMYLHLLDISSMLTEGTVKWLPPVDDCCGVPPEETIFYSLVLGRGELIMFGGNQTDLSNMQRGINVKSQIVSNNVHFIRATKTMI